MEKSLVRLRVPHAHDMYGQGVGTDPQVAANLQLGVDDAWRCAVEMMVVASPV